MIRATVCVGWRPGQPDRERNWDQVREFYRSLGYPVVAADSDPARPFRLTEAVNRAVLAAEGWDVVIIPDADTFIIPEALVEAVEVAASGAMVRPTARYWRLDPDGSPPAEPERFQAGGVQVFGRDTWDLIGGYDERFDRWGGHDSAALWAAATYGSLIQTDGDVYHLWHPQDDAAWLSGVAQWEDAVKTEPDAPEGWGRNGARPLPPLAKAYRDAMGDERAMAAILSAKTGPPALACDLVATCRP